MAAAVVKSGAERINVLTVVMVENCMRAAARSRDIHASWLRPWLFANRF
jgi:hypothetical protein